MRTTTRCCWQPRHYRHRRACPTLCKFGPHRGSNKILGASRCGYYHHCCQNQNTGAHKTQIITTRAVQKPSVGSAAADVQESRLVGCHDDTAKVLLHQIRLLKQSKRWPHHCFLDSDKTGPVFVVAAVDTVAVDRAQRDANSQKVVPKKRVPPP
jgi:hypothetical protein